MISDSIIKICIIGTGRMATEYLNVLKKFINIEVCGVLGRDFNRTRSFAEKNKIRYTATDVNDLYNKTNADGVIVCVTETSTEKVCLDLLNFPWIALVEKPVGLSYESTTRILNYNYSSYGDIFVALNRRHYSTIKYLSADLKNENSKRLVQIQDQQNPIIALNNGWNKEVCDNWFFANSVHLIDLFFEFCRGEIIYVNNINTWKNDYIPKFTHSIISFSSGDTGIYTSIWNMPAPWSLSVQTNNKYFLLKPMENLSIYSNENKSHINFSLDQLDLTYKPGFYSMIDNFISQILKSQSDLISLKQYAKTAKLISDLYSSKKLIKY